MYSVDKSKTYRDLQKVIEGTIRGTTKKNLTNALKNNSKKHAPEEAVICPFGVDENDWIAIHVFEFYKDLNYLFCIVMDDCKPDKCPKMTASHAYEYLWVSKAGVKPCHLPAREYIDRLFEQVETSLIDEYLFPTNEEDPYPPDFIKRVSELLKRLYRVYAHIYFNHYGLLQLVGATEHFNESFQKFVFFVGQYRLVSSVDLKPCYRLIITKCKGSQAYKEYMHEEQEPNNATEDMPPYPNAGPVASSIPRPPAALVHPPPIVNSPYNIHHQPLPLKETETPSTIPGTQPILISSSPVRTPVNADPSDTKPLVQQELNPIPEEEEKEPSLDSNEQPPKEQPIVIPPTIIEEQEPPKSSPSEPKVDDLDNAIDRIAQNRTEGAIGVHAQPVSESAVPQLPEQLEKDKALSSAVLNTTAVQAHLESKKALQHPEQEAPMNTEEVEEEVVDVQPRRGCCMVM